MTEQFSFHWVSRFLDSDDYEVVGDGAPYRITLRFGAGAYERSIFNGDEAAWQREAVSAVGFLCRGDTAAISQSVVDQFNAWRATEHAQTVRELQSRPDLFGPVPEGDPRLESPRTVQGARYVTGIGWIELGKSAPEVAASESGVGQKPITRIRDLFMYKLS
jgi:hypothetical protein